jgi:hypothetical protein
MAHPFLSDEWIAATREIRQRHAGDEQRVEVPIKMNQTVTDVPFGGGTVESYVDTSTGILVFELGQLESPDVTITTDYETAKAIFVDQNQAVAMQAFLSGKIRVQGDMMKLMALQTAMPNDPRAAEIASEIKAITA